MTRVKICGITNAEDARAACEAGVDAIGLNFYPRSPRALSVNKAAELRAQIPSGVQVFGVFVNAEVAEVMEIFRNVRLHALQLHGDESPITVAQLARIAPVFKALRVGPEFSAVTLESYPGVSGFLFDTADAGPGQYGGTGRLADWEVAQQVARSHRVILAGGLNADNVAAAILQVRPYGVDVASGVEASPGAKDHAQLREFVREARRADQELNSPVEKVPAR
ncbi:MAG TPA: phosphoribosylanthranilate isomerase [Candidatus Acidoferrales bacterium]|nr:phosphoribosylanthranilate isomerase [Candidatus Acidoferrales bacterium]